MDDIDVFADILLSIKNKFNVIEEFYAFVKSTTIVHISNAISSQYAILFVSRLIKSSNECDFIY